MNVQAVKNASDIKLYLESAGFRADAIQVKLGRWIDIISIFPAEGEKADRLKKLLPRLANFIGAKGIVLGNYNNKIILELLKSFNPISENEITASGEGLCIGLTFDDRPLMVDIRRGGLLIIGDPGTGKTILMEQCRKRLQGQFDVIDVDNDIIKQYGDISTGKEKLVSETILLADNFEKLTECSQRDLLYIAMKGHLIGVYVIASISNLNAVTLPVTYVFKNIVSFRLGQRIKVPSISTIQASSLGAYGDGIFKNAKSQIRFHTTNFSTMNINQKENALFEEWMEHLKKNDSTIDVESLFCPDGLHYSGQPVKRDGKHFVIDRDYKEEQLWGNSNRVVFLSKDHNLRSDDEGVDVRDESGLDNETGHIEPHFFKRYLLLNYGLGKINLVTGDYPDYLEATSEECLNYFHSCAVVRMNVKKIAGGDNCSQASLRACIDTDKEFIRRQLDLYGGQIFVCLDGSETSQIMKFLKTLYNDINRYDAGEEYNFIYFSESAKAVVIHEWHPSNRIGYELYYSAVRQLSMFIKSHPGFFK